MKIALVMPLAEQRGGAELMLMYLLRANARGPGIEYHIAFLEDGPMAAETKALGYPVQGFPAGRLRQPRRYIQTVRALHTWILRERLDAVVSWMAKAQLYAGPAAYFAGKPAVWCQHGIPNRHWLNRSATFLPADTIFCCSLAAQQAQQDLSPRRNTKVIHPAIDLECFNTARLPAPPEMRERLGLPRSGPVVGMVSRLQRWKGIHVFVEAAVRLAGRDPKTHFVVVGGAHFSEPDFPAELAAQVRHAGMAEQFTFAGFRRNVAEWVQAMDVLVHASVEPEPFGMVILEGMALGKPVIATAAGGPKEIIAHDQNGLLVQPGNAEAMASAIDRLLSDEGFCSRLGVAACQRAQAFDTDRLAREMAARVTEVAR